MKNRFIPVLTAACLAATVFAGCGGDGGKGDGKTKLSAPVITLTDNVITWAKVENATSYTVYCDDATVESVTELSYTIDQTEPGTYTYSLTANTTDEKYTTSDKSNTVEYKVEEIVGDPVVYLVGDSTVCSFNDNYYIPRYGYGTQIANYLTEGITVNNLAISGRSSLSFLTEDNYTTLKTSIKAGDYLIIGFGHNDEKFDDAGRYTNPVKGYEDTSTENGRSFQNVLYENYVKLAKSKRATPILCTPVVRYDPKGAYEGEQVHVTEKGDYVKAIKDLGASTDTTVVDLTGITKAMYQADNTNATKFHAHKTYKDEATKEPYDIDKTHLSMYGAKKVAYALMSEIAVSSCSLSEYVKPDMIEPTNADYEASINKSYVKPPYAPFDPANKSVNWTTITSEGWYGTTMGNLGGNDAVKPFVVEEANGVFTVGNRSYIKEDGVTVAGKKKGKLENPAAGGGTDGFAAVFMQVPRSQNFTISATATVKTNEGADKQSGFGIMLRDDIYIDSTVSVNTNYVAAGVLAGGVGAIFSRENGTFTAKGHSASADVGQTYNMSIERKGQAVTVKVNDYVEDTCYTDFDFFAVDGEYMYICLFGTRGIVAEFSNVVYTPTGTAIEA